MALLKTKTPAAEPFIVPPLTSHPDYAALIDKRTALIDRKAAVRSEKRELERQIMDTPAPALRRGVAELLDEAGDRHHPFTRPFVRTGSARSGHRRGA
jgi:hypothetical protein